MTLEQAQAQAAASNEIINEYVDTFQYYVITEWDSQFIKEYATMLLPYKYEDQFKEADYSVQLAFARVALKALVTDYKTPADYVINYDNLIPEDEELNNYLNPA